MGLTEAGASALSAGIGFLGNLGGSIASGIFASREAKKNRQFQEKMYNKQVEDNIKFWNMQNAYNDPSAALERIRNAGMNPLLLYGEGGLSGNLAQNPVQSGQAPHGAQGQASFNTRIDLANLALVEAQADALKAQAEDSRQAAKLKGEQAFGQNIQNEIDWRTRDALVDARKGNVAKLNQEIEWLATQDFALTNMTAANLDNIASMIEYRKKYYDIDFAKAQNAIWYNIESIAIGKAHVSNELKEIAVKMYEAKTNRTRMLGELKVFSAQVNEINSRSDLNEAQKSDEYLKAYNQFLRNSMLENIGTDNLGGAAGLMLLLTGSVSGRIGD